MTFLWRCFVAALLCSVAHGQLRILSPDWLIGEFKDTRGNIQGTTATFGAPYYGERLIGQLRFGPSLHNHTHCTKDDYSILGNDEVVENGFKKMRLINIILVQRGTCTFVTKVRVAEAKGAHAVIIVDKMDSQYDSKSIQKIIMADDGYGDKIDIPSVMIAKDDGKRLIDAVKREPVIVELAWDIPTNHIVVMDLWMSSASQEVNKFLTQFQNHARHLDKNLRFVPHFYVFSMPADYNDLCSDGTARFCAEDPDGSGPITGAMVLREDVRQLCILETTQALVDAKAQLTATEAAVDAKSPIKMDVDRTENIMRKHGGYHWSWWDYVIEFSKRCVVEGAADKDELHRFGDTCSKEVMKGISSINIEDVDRCVARSTDTKLEEQKGNAAWSSRAIRINGWRYSGQLDPDLVTRALCSGFIVQPQECKALIEPRNIFQDEHAPPAATGLGFGQFLLVLALVVMATLLALLLYKRFLTKYVHSALREEVMLEVRTQMDTYRELPS